MVVDASALLALLFDEPHADWVAEQLNRHADRLCMSTVNLAEVLIRLRDRQPALAGSLEQRILTSGIRFVSPDVTQAQEAARARLAFPMNLGDCFAYALARSEGVAVLTLDEDFRQVDLPVVMP